MEDLKISKKKPSYPVIKKLHDYLSEYNRNIRLPIFYDDLLRFQGSVVVYDKHDVDTLWIRVYYSDSEREEIDLSLKKVYNILQLRLHPSIIALKNKVQKELKTNPNKIYVNKNSVLASLNASPRSRCPIR